MPQVVFKLPPASKAPRAQAFVTEGYRACQHAEGRGDNPYPETSLRWGWWDSGWCECELLGCPPETRDELERWLAGGGS